MDDAEILARMVYRRDHIDAHGRLHRRALTVQEFLKRDGLSVVRRDSLSTPELRALRVRFEGRSQLSFLREALLETGAVRGILQAEHRVFCVVDDAQPDCRAHALIRLERSRQWTRATVRQVRDRLLGLFRPPAAVPPESRA